MLVISEKDLRPHARRHSRVAALLLGFTAGLAMPADPVSARDRPDTPNGATLGGRSHDPTQKPSLCLSFYNAAAEDVRIEMEANRNGGVAATFDKMFCETGVSCYMPPPTITRWRKEAIRPSNAK